jgi:glycosyltransferase involved in cell wall biosynthesis
MMVSTSRLKKKILIGFLSKTIKGPIPIITNVYIEGLKDKYDFVPFYQERTIGKERLASFNFINLYYFIYHYYKWCLSLIKNKPDIVHFPITSFWNMEKSLLFLATAKMFGVKRTIGHLHGGAFIDFWQQTNSIRRFLALKQFKELDVFIVLSESWKLNIIKYVGIEENKIRVLNNLIDKEFEEHFKDFRRDYYEKPVITFLGFNLMDSRKGLFDVLEATSLLKNKNSFKIVIIGDEREPKVLEQAKRMIEEKKLSDISLSRGVWGAEKIKWFEKADVLILPSYIENFPVVVLEAACAGIPVIASKVGALPDIFTNDTDILFLEAGDKPQLAKLIDRLISNQDERRRLGENIKCTFNRELQGKRIIDQLDVIYRDLF